MTERKIDPSVAPFSTDIFDNAGYLYTTNARLSSRMANRRLTSASLALANLNGRRVIDIGCGDGTYTVELAKEGGAAFVVALDPAEAAVQVARSKLNGSPIHLSVGSAFALPHPDSSFDVAYLRGVLHHMTDPELAIGEALRVAATVVVIEPNGYNPVLKLLERYSSYHVEHGEKSYAPRQLDRWVSERGGTLARHTFAGLVPMFCPDWLARAAKRFEPLVERLPLARALFCAVYVFSARSNPSVPTALDLDH